MGRLLSKPKKSPYVAVPEPAEDDVVLEQLYFLCLHWQEHKNAKCAECQKYEKVREILWMPWTKKILVVKST